VRILAANHLQQRESESIGVVLANILKPAPFYTFKSTKNYLHTPYLVLFFFQKLPARQSYIISLSLRLTLSSNDCFL
jgi:hypothetical protein